MKTTSLSKCNRYCQKLVDNVWFKNKNIIFKLEFRIYNFQFNLKINENKIFKQMLYCQNLIDTVKDNKQL